MTTIRLRKPTLACAGVALLLAGCAVGPDYRAPPPAPVPAAWQTPETQQPKAPDLERWWTRLGDPTLDRLIGEAVEGNLDVATAQANVRAARASYRQSGGTLWPSLQGSAGFSRARTAPAQSGSAAGARTGNLFQAGFDAAWELDLFGGNRRAAEAAGYGIDAAEADLRAALLTLIGDVATNYAEARGYAKRIELARRIADLQRETANLTRARFSVGTGTAMDAASAEAEVASTEAQIPQLETARAAAVHRLGILLGRAPGAVAELMAAAADLPRLTVDPPRAAPAEVLNNRPDVAAAERALAQATARIGAAEAARYPDISLTGSIATYGREFGDLGKQSSLGWSFGPTVTIPIFRGGALEAAVELAQAERDQAFLAYHGAVLTALEDVENASVALAQERNRRDRLAAQVGHSQEAARLSRLLYDNGATAFLDVLVAERTLYSAQQSLLESDVAVVTDYVALAKALGGGWSQPVDSARPVVVDADMGPRFR